MRTYWKSHVGPPSKIILSSQRSTYWCLWMDGWSLWKTCEMWTLLQVNSKNVYNRFSMLLKYYVLTPSIIYYRATPKFRRPKELPECNLDCYREEQQRAKQQEACEEYQKFMMECCPNRCPDPMVIEPLDPENPIAVELPYLKNINIIRI